MEIACSERIKKANLIENPFEIVPCLNVYKNAGLSIKLESVRRCYLSENIRDWSFKLLEKNMKTIYESSKSGWNAKEKLEEMFDPKAYYIIAYNSESNKPVGFCHFRFDMDFDNEVIYCYELQIESEMRRVGLGKYLMEVLESLCEKLELEKVMLTVSKYNKVGLSFFKDKMKYSRDETDMNDEEPNIDYEILSKVFWEEDAHYEED